MQSLVLCYLTRSEAGSRLMTRAEVRRNLEKLGVSLDEERPITIPEMPILTEVPDMGLVWDGLGDDDDIDSEEDDE